MTPESHESEWMIRYLTGELSEADAQRFERRYFEDPKLLEELDATEADLIEAYLQNRLSPDRTLHFEDCYLATPERRRRVEIARSLHYHLSSSTRSIQRPNALFSSLLLRGGAVAAALLMVFGISALLRYRETTSNIRAFHQSLSKGQPQTVHIRLLSVSPRGVGAKATGNFSSMPTLVEFHFPGGIDLSKATRIVIRDPDDGGLVWIQQIPPGTSPKSIVVPWPVVSTGADYVLAAERVSRAGSVEEIAAYSFRITR